MQPDTLTLHERLAATAKAVRGRSPQVCWQLLKGVFSSHKSVTGILPNNIFFVRSILEQSATVRRSSRTQESKEDLERVQKSALKMI